MKNFTLRRICILLAVGLFAAAPLTAVGAVYKSMTPDGSVTYSDTPQAGAQEVELAPEPPPPVTPLAVTPPADANTKQTAATPPAQPPTQPEFTGYTSFAIVSPEHDAALRVNNGDVGVQLVMEPALNTELGHKVIILLDNKPVAEGQAMTATLPNVERGTHTVEAQIMDASGTLIATSNPVTFHLKRISTISLNNTSKDNSDYLDSPDNPGDNPPTNPLQRNPLLAPSFPSPSELQAPRAPQGPTAPSLPIEYPAPN